MENNPQWKCSYCGESNETFPGSGLHTCEASAEMGKNLFSDPIDPFFKWLQARDNTKEKIWKLVIPRK